MSTLSIGINPTSDRRSAPVGTGDDSCLHLLGGPVSLDGEADYASGGVTDEPARRRAIPDTDSCSARSLEQDGIQSEASDRRQDPRNQGPGVPRPPGSGRRRGTRIGGRVAALRARAPARGCPACRAPTPDPPLGRSGSRSYRSGTVLRRRAGRCGRGRRGGTHTPSPRRGHRRWRRPTPCRASLRDCVDPARRLAPAELVIAEVSSAMPASRISPAVVDDTRTCNPPASASVRDASWIAMPRTSSSTRSTSPACTAVRIASPSPTASRRGFADRSLGCRFAISIASLVRM